MVTIKPVLLLSSFSDEGTPVYKNKNISLLTTYSIYQITKTKSPKFQ